MKQREYYFDNAKFILIFFVVFGHLLRTFIEENEVIYSLYKVIYTFHMPAFILVSGFFAKSFRKKGYVIKVAKKLIVPYLVFQTIYSFFYYFLYHKPQITIDPLDPHWSLWFLISLFFWNIMLYGVARFHWKYSLTITLMAALFIGFFDSISNYLSLSRTFVFFPLFLLGYYLKKEHFYHLLNGKLRMAAGVIFLLVLVGFYLFPNLDYEWLLGSKPYAEMGVDSFTAMFTRLGVYGLSIIMMACFFALVPTKRYFFTNLGRNSLYVYLLHGFFIRLFRVSEVKNYFSDVESFLLLAVISLSLTLVLSSKTITSFAQPLIELKVSNTKELIMKLLWYVRFYRTKRWNH
ncbi:acyltransferase family protein [Bacillus tuaregi]|uniref:acyltransferase family protein n=1 Tax=Bacillus tuaregi TaxID=1816695 RepID=UPI0008F885CB|nr:acyltransferase family protein [Bacillus tuaregi]